MKLRYFGLVMSLVTTAGSTGAAVWFLLQPNGRTFFLGMVPWVLGGMALTVYWLGRILATRLLEPGECECGHIRCCHVQGVGECYVSYGVSDKFPRGSSCACKLFISKDQEPKPDSDVERLKKMAGLK